MIKFKLVKLSAGDLVLWASIINESMCIWYIINNLYICDIERVAYYIFSKVLIKCASSKYCCKFSINIKILTTNKLKYGSKKLYEIYL